MSTDSAPQQSLTSILIVDDEWMMVEVMTEILRKLRYEDVDFAADGMTALQMMQDKPYGLVISDVNMEPMGGLDLLRTVRADPGLKATPFILTTASRAPDTVFAAKRSVRKASS